MSDGSSRGHYEARLHRVLAHIDARLAEPLALADLAAVAHFSPYHFHRLFAAWTGRTLGEYVRQRRLERAATRLTSQPRASVLDVAIGVGFGSGEAFARAFKDRFGCSPSAWRGRRRRGPGGATNRNPDQAAAAPAPEDAAPCLPPPEASNVPPPTDLRVTLTEAPPVPVAYLRRHGSYGPELTRFWVDTVTPWLAANGLKGRSLYGIAHDDPDVVSESQCRYDACVRIEPAWKARVAADRGVFTATLAGGRYAVASLAGDNAAINGAWRWLLRDWLPDSGLQLDDRPMFEHYPPSSLYDPATGRIGCELFLPVTPL
ncbi:MAG: helix-turn-helix domain-containing protein [Rubrivivax sp.]|nr:helix-turn-helix domain-containing protein [Rubrivivax sp.]